MQTIASRIGVPVQFEPTGTSDAPTITCKAENVRAFTLLKRILAPRQLGWLVSDAGLRIVPREVLEKELEVRVYDVSDLIESKAEGKAEPDFTELIKVLQTTEGAAGKSDQPSPASMAGMRLQSRKVLVVKGTRERQSRIARLINRLRITQWQLQPRGGLGMGSF